MKPHVENSQQRFSPTLWASILLAMGLTACGGQAVNDTQHPATACDTLCIDQINATQVAMLKGDTSTYNARLQGTLASTAQLSWDMGDGSATRTGTQINEHIYSHPGMYRITVNAKATDSQGVVQTASKSLQIHVIQPQTLLASGGAVLAIDTNGTLRVSSDEPYAYLGYNVAKDQKTRNFAPVTDAQNMAGNFKLRSVWGCDLSYICEQTFALALNGTLYGAGNDQAYSSGDAAAWLTSTTRSTSVDSAATPQVFAISLDNNNQPLNNIKYIEQVSTSSGTSSYALRGDGSLYTAGVNEDGQLAQGHARRSERFARTADARGFVSDAVQVAISRHKAYVLRSDGSLWTAGSNNPGVVGSLGIASNSSDDRNLLVATQDNAGKALTGVKEVYSDSDGAVYALRWDNSLWVAGNNTNGRLGLGITSNGDMEQGFRPASGSDGSALSHVVKVIPNRDGSNQTVVLLDNGAVLLAGADATRFGVAASDVDSRGHATRFAVVRNLETQAPLTGMVQAGFVRGPYDYMGLIDTTGQWWVLGTTGNSSLPYGVTDPADTSTNLELTGQVRAARYANWKNTDTGNFYDLRESLDTHLDSVIGLNVNLAFIDAVTSPKVTAFSFGVYASALIDAQGQLYVAANRTNQYASTSAYVPMFPGVNGLRFKTGLE